MKTLNNLRQNLLEIRLRSNRDDVQRKSLENKVAAFFDQLNDCCVAIYWPINSEFDLRPLALNWARYHPNRTIALPIVQLNEPLQFGNWTEATTMQKGPQGINEPLIASNSDCVRPDIIIAPCLAGLIKMNSFGELVTGADTMIVRLPFIKRSSTTVAQ